MKEYITSAELTTHITCAESQQLCKAQLSFQIPFVTYHGTSKHEHTQRAYFISRTVRACRPLMHGTKDEPQPSLQQLEFTTRLLMQMIEIYRYSLSNNMLSSPANHNGRSRRHCYRSVSDRR
jgi:hypothetical protein